MLSFFKKKKDEAVSTKELSAFLSGKVISIDEVKDSVFSSKMLGDGVAIEPKTDLPGGEGYLYVVSPCNGVITTVMEESRHAVGITADNGMELLIHEGIDTVALKGEGFKLFVSEGDRVKAGDGLLSFQPEVLKQKGYDMTCILAISNYQEFPELKFHVGMEAVAGETKIASV